MICVSCSPSLDDRHLTCRRSKLARPRRQAKSRRYEGAVANRDAKHDFSEFETRTQQPAPRLEIRIHGRAGPGEADADADAARGTPPPAARRARDWGSKGSAGKKNSRKSASTPPMPLERVVVLDEVGADDAPVCGINLGPFLSWLNCMPAIPEERHEEEEYDPIQSDVPKKDPPKEAPSFWK